MDSIIFLFTNGLFRCTRLKITSIDPMSFLMCAVGEAICEEEGVNYNNIFINMKNLLQ